MFLSLPLAWISELHQNQITSITILLFITSSWRKKEEKKFCLEILELICEFKILSIELNPNYCDIDQGIGLGEFAGVGITEKRKKWGGWRGAACNRCWRWLIRLLEWRGSPWFCTPFGCLGFGEGKWDLLFLMPLFLGNCNSSHCYCQICFCIYLYIYLCICAPVCSYFLGESTRFLLCTYNLKFTWK